MVSEPAGRFGGDFLGAARTLQQECIKSFLRFFIALQTEVWGF